MPKLVFALICVVASVGCSGTVPRTSYTMPLEAVQRPSDTQERWGNYTVEKTDSAEYTYSDQLVDVVVLPARGAFVMNVQNKTEHSLQILWDEMAYVGPTGLTSKVSSGDTRVIDMGKAQTPTVIPAKAKAALTAIPVDNYVVNLSAGNQMKDFICVGEPYTELEGKEIRLLVPIRVQDVANEYTFTFRLQNITPPEMGALAEQCG